MGLQDTYRVVLVDDHPLFRKGIRNLLETEDIYRVTGEAGTGKEAIRLILETLPELVLLDIRLPDMSGLQVVEHLRSKGFCARIVALTVSDEEGDVIRALRIGVDGYLLKSIDADDLLFHLRSAMGGGVALSRELNTIIAHSMRRRDSKPVEEHTTELTCREHVILGLIAQGLSNKEIARKLEIADGTVKVHVKNILKKLGVSSRVQAARWVYLHQEHFKTMTETHASPEL